MDQVINKVNSVDPNNSEAVKEALALFFQNIIKKKEFNCSKWLRELNTIINRFPKYCTSHRNNTENYLASFLSSYNYLNVVEAAKCANALQQVRPSKEKRATPKSSWRDQMSLLCNTAHTLISTLFPNAVEMYKDTDTPQTPKSNSPLCTALIDITKKLKNAKDKQTQLQIRLKNVFIFIQAMLVEIYPVAKPVRPQVILDVVVRALSVSSGINTAGVNVASVKIQALRTLDALIMCLGSNLLSFSPLVIRCVMQTLRWSSDNSSEGSRKVRCTAYRTLQNWMTTLHIHKASDSRNGWEDELSTHIVNDITPTRKVVELTMGPQPTKHLSKKAKRKLATTQIQESTIAAHMPGEKNKIVVSEEINNTATMAALECAEVFFTVCGRFLKPAIHKLFHELIIRECYNSNSYEENQLLGLLRVLEATRKTTPTTVAPPTQHCLHLYSSLVHLNDAEITKFCTQALLDIRLHLHCSPPSLTFSLELPKDLEKPTNVKKKVSERNRAVLQSLLGVDISQANENEIITIPDEPLNKKPRLNDVDESEKISLSSSLSSVEICDDSGEENMEVEVIQQNIEDIEESPVVDEDNVEIEPTAQDITDIAPTQETVMNNIDKDKPIHEAKTQLPLNNSVDTIEDENLSLEVGYDYPNTGTEKVTVLERIDDDNLPSTNDTDDIQITCGQVMKNSQDIDLEKKSDDKETINEVPKVNGINSDEKIIENGISEDAVDSVETTVKVAANNGISVEAMLADFVDEVVDEAIKA